MIHTVIATVTLSVALVALPASAQPSLSARPGHGFATVGVIGARNDPADAVDLNQPVSRGHWVLKGAVFVAPRVGVGIETYPEHNTTVVRDSHASFGSSEQLQERRR